MEQRNISLEMVDLYLQGTAPRQLCEIYGVSASFVGNRLKRMGYPRPFRPRRSIAGPIDKVRLRNLYEDERWSCQRIADELGVSVGIIRKALKLYGIPKRAALSRGGKYFGILKLRIGETREIRYRDETQIANLRQSAETLGILIDIKQKGEKMISLTRLSEDEPRRIAAIAAIDRDQLTELYLDQKLSLFKIARRLGLGADMAEQALDFYQIPRRRPVGHSIGKYASVFRQIEVGETVDIECRAKYPHNNLHSIANRIGIKISMQRINDGFYRLTRLE